MFIFVFVLIGLWASLEFTLSYFNDVKHKKGNMLVSSLVILCVISTFYFFDKNLKYIHFSNTLDNYEYSERQINDYLVVVPLKFKKPNRYNWVKERCKKYQYAIYQAAQTDAKQLATHVPRIF
ncbi:MAG: hypothetical protein HRT54_21680 [Colwellia sp.]|nr:hypothetical protein [Colwellia sp.]